MLKKLLITGGIAFVGYVVNEVRKVEVLNPDERKRV